MTAKYEWTDDAGLRHPSIVYLDVTEVEDDLSLPAEHLLSLSAILKVKKIDSFGDVFNSNGLLDRRKVRMPGYDFRWHYKVMDSEYYALFVAFVKKEEMWQ